MKNFILYTAGLLILFVPEFMRVYLIMPFPGSQQNDTIALAYFINQYIPWFRLIGAVLLFFPLKNYFSRASALKKTLLLIPVLLYAGIYYLFNYKFSADHMFYQPATKILAAVSENKVERERLIIGVSIHGKSKAYPVEIIGYHHQVRDSIDGIPIMVTYCTVCRTGRVFSPVFKGTNEQFRLVGMDHFNAMFEDATTKSWWRQATGEAVAGALKGERLNEILSEQMTLQKWIDIHPETTILQPDPKFKERYAGLSGFDNGTIKNSLEYTDTGSWQKKSWVIGIQTATASKAYDWRQLLGKHILEDRVGEKPILIVIDNDSLSYHVLSREINGKIYSFRSDSAGTFLTDENTKSTWTAFGKCISGVMAGTNLEPVISSQEFWHSWKEFHPGTLKFE